LLLVPILIPPSCLLSLRCFLLLTNCKEFLPCPSCVQLCSGLNSCYGRSRVRCGKSDRLKKTPTTHDSFVVKSFLAAGKRAPIIFSLSFSVFLRIDLLLLLGYYYCCCCFSVAVVIKIQKIFNRKNNNYDVK